MIHPITIPIVVPIVLELLLEPIDSLFEEDEDRDVGAATGSVVIVVFRPKFYGFCSIDDG
jgi:hypothetical protein